MPDRPPRDAHWRLRNALREFERIRREDDEGGAGVREPRRPQPTAPSAAAALEHELEEAYA